MPRGGIQTSLVAMVNAMAAPFRRQSAGARGQGKGAPILSYSWGQNGGGPSGAAPGGTRDIAQFAPGYPLVPVERAAAVYNFPTGVNYIYTPRSFEEIGFPELKALARDDITRL